MENFTIQDMASLSWKTFLHEVEHRPPSNNFLSDFIEEFSSISQIGYKELSQSFLIAVVLTIHRYIVSAVIFKPFARLFNLSKKDETKVVESSSRLLYYLLFYILEYYVLIILYPQYRWNPSSHWRDWSELMSVPNEIQYLYIVQSGFYFHAMYATLMMDTWKKDSIPMLLHHLLANLLIIFSLAVRYHRIGLLVLYLHDSADVLLESTKIIVSIKNKYDLSTLNFLANIGFLLFAANWFWCRLVIYPQYVIFSSLHISITIIPDGHFYFFFNSMLLILWLLNIWWFHFIIMLLVRIVTGQVKSVDDTREYDRENNTTGKSEGRKTLSMQKKLN